MFLGRKYFLMNVMGGIGEGGSGDGGAGDDGSNIVEPPVVPPSVPEWATGIQLDDPNILSEPMFRTITNVSDVVKGYYHAQKMVGADRIPVPGKTATPEEWNAFYQKANGIPTNKEEYKVELPTTIEDEAFKNALTQKAYELNLRPDQLKEIVAQMEEHNNTIAKNYEAQEAEEIKKVSESFVKKWGNDAKRNMMVAQRAVEHFAGKEGLDAILASPLSNNPTFIDLMFNIGKGMVGEDNFTKEVIGSFGMSKEDAQREINRITGDMSGPYFDDRHAQHKDMVKKVSDLYKIIS